MQVPPALPPVAQVMAALPFAEQLTVALLPRVQVAAEAPVSRQSTVGFEPVEHIAPNPKAASLNRMARGASYFGPSDFVITSF